MDEIQYSQLTPEAVAENGEGGLERLRDVPVDLVVEISRTKMTIGEALKLAPGTVIGLNRLAGDPVNLLVNGKPIARGEVVVVDEEFGLRVTEVVNDGGATVSVSPAVNGSEPEPEHEPEPEPGQEAEPEAQGPS